MNDSRLFVLFAILLLPMSASAQHGTADNGYFPNGYNGDTWSGVVSSVAPGTKEVSLVYTHHGKTAVFQGMLSKGSRVQANGDKKKQQIMSEGISIGARIRVYYIPNQTSDDLGGGPFPFKAFGNNLLEAQRDAKRPFNLIFLVEFLQDEAESRTGIVISTKDSTREITLAVGDGTKTENFTGVVIDNYQVKMKDGSLRDLVVSEIPTGTKTTVQYFDEMTGPERTTGEVHRIYRVRFVAFPQNP
jgi:hypothetical protein